MQNLLLTTIPYAELETLILKSVQLAVQSATLHLQPKQNNEYLTRKETSKILGISLVTLNDWTKNGKIKGYRIGSRIRYKRHEIEQSLLTIKCK